MLVLSAKRPTSNRAELLKKLIKLLFNRLSRTDAAEKTLLDYIYLTIDTTTLLRIKPNPSIV